MEHVSSADGTSPSANSYLAPPQNSQQYQQLAGSPQHLVAAQSNQMQVQQQQQEQTINASPSAQPQQQMTMMPQWQTTQGTYDYSPEEQAEILDLDSHKVQTHRYEEQLRRIQQNNMQHADMDMAWRNANNRNSPILQPLASPVYHHTRVPSPMAQHQQHQQPQHQILLQAAMGFPPVSSGLLLSHDQQQLQMDTFSQIGAPSHQVMPSDHIYMQAPVVHANTPTLQHTMESTSPVLPTMASKASFPAESLMEGTMMPHQLYPDEQLPHVFSLTKTTQLIDNGNLSIHQSNNREMLPGFDIFNNPQMLSSFTSNEGFIVHSQTANMGGLRSESLNSQNRPFESQPINYDAFAISPSIINMESNQVEQQMSFDQSPDPVIQESPNNIVDQIDEQETNSNTVTTKAEAKAAKNRNENKNRVIVTDNSGESVEKFRCDPCNKFFNRACYLTQHNRSFHSGDKPHKCSQCGKRFGDSKKFHEHLRKHTGERAHKCELCPKQFNHKTDLRRHMCLHTGEKPFVCEVCRKGFIRKDHMVKHKLTHAKKALNQEKKNKVKKNIKKVKQIDFSP